MELNFSDKTKWLHNQILALLAAFQKYHSIPGLRKPQIYEKMSADLLEDGIERSAKQCQYKFAALKKLYVKFKDSQKATNSGGSPISFPYASEMHDIFGESHILGLKRTASSSRPLEGLLNPTQESGVCTGTANILEDDEDEPTFPTSTKKRRVTVAESVREECQNILIESKRQHQDKMDLAKQVLTLQEKALQESNSFLKKILEKFEM